MTRLLLMGALALSVAFAQTPPAQVRTSALVNGAELLRDLQVLSADDMEGRRPETPGGDKARAYVIERFKATGVEMLGESYLHPFTFTGGRGSTTERHGANVVGRITGTRQPNRYVVISAHYDHVGTNNGQVFNGADDNASGTAALFAVAKYFSAHKPETSLLLVAFDAEEAGLRGSSAFAQKPPVDAAAIVIDLNMDMIGRDPDDKLFVVGTFLQPYLKPMIQRVAATAPVKLLIGHDDPNEKGVEDWTRDSDHYSFIRAKIPALYFGVEDFGQHHKATDDYETMSHDFYIRAVETMIGVIQEFDKNVAAVDKGRAEQK